MAFLPASYEFKNGAAFGEFKTTAGVAIKKGQIVSPGADDETITGTTDINFPHGVALESIAATDTGPNRTTQIRLLGTSIIFMISNGTVTRGSKLIPVAGTGLATNAGAAPDFRQLVGKAMVSEPTAGNWFPAMLS